MKERISFQDAITSNKIKSAILMASIIAIFVILGYSISYVLDPSFFFIIMIISIIFSLIYVWIGYYYSADIAIKSVKAEIASPIKHRALIHSVENMALAAGLPIPKVYVMQSNQINAFASGRDPRHAVICVTTDALDKLNKQELEGVIAHEMAHIANYDIRFMTLATILIGMISIAAEIFLRSLYFSDEGENKNIALIVLGIIFAIAAPIAAQLAALAISRKREFTADATGVKFTRYPLGLANALRKINDDHDAITEKERHRYAQALAPLFIGDPFKKISSLFSTHPNIKERIKRLEQM